MYSSRRDTQISQVTSHMRNCVADFNIMVVTVVNFLGDYALTKFYLTTMHRLMRVLVATAMVAELWPIYNL